MLSDWELRSLNKIANSSLLKRIYPMVDRVDISYYGEGRVRGRRADNYKVAVYLNDDTITHKNMYEKQFDPYYLLQHYIENEFFYYLGIPRGNFISSDNNQFYIEVYSPDGSIVVTDY
jgi:hypothetical protein